MSKNNFIPKGSHLVTSIRFYFVTYFLGVLIFTLSAITLSIFNLSSLIVLIISLGLSAACLVFIYYDRYYEEVYKTADKIIYDSVEKFTLPAMDIPSEPLNAAAKRLMDIFISSVALLLLAPFFLVVAIKIKSEDPGSVFYYSPRVGRGGKEFGLLKFRTMYERPEAYKGNRNIPRDDERFTPTGRWLRDTKLNELPQLWNVLVGEMSLVGPRPEDPEFSKRWPADLRREILSIRPGITGPASISYYNKEELLSGENAVSNYLNIMVPDVWRLDSLYVRHHTFLSDLDTIFWTIILALPRLGKTRVPESWLFGGPLTRFIRRYFSWFLIDFCLALVSISALGLIWRLSGPLDIGWLTAAFMTVCLSFALSFFNVLLGLKSVSWDRPAAEDVLKLIVSCLLVGLSYFILHIYFGLTSLLPNTFILSAVLVALFSFIIARYRLRLLTGLASRWVALRGRGSIVGKRVLVVGTGDGVEIVSKLLLRPDFRRYYHIVGIADDNPSKQGLLYTGLNVIGTTSEIPELVKQHKIDIIVYAANNISSADNERILSFCRNTNLPMLTLEGFVSLRWQFSYTNPKMNFSTRYSAQHQRL